MTGQTDRRKTVKKENGLSTVLFFLYELLNAAIRQWPNR